MGYTSWSVKYAHGRVGTSLNIFNHNTRGFTGIIILTTQILSIGLRKLRQPRVIAEVLGGILLGMMLTLF